MNNSKINIVIILIQVSYTNKYDTNNVGVSKS